MNEQIPLRRPPSRAGFLWALAARRHLLAHLRRLGWDVKETDRTGADGKSYAAVVREHGRERTAMIQCRQPDRWDILGELYACYHGPSDPRNRPGSDQGDYDLKIVHTERNLLVVDGPAHRRLLRGLLEGRRWDRLLVRRDRTTKRRKLLCFVAPEEHPDGSVRFLPPVPVPDVPLT